ncbi:MAG: hypothetical protein GX444_16790 [Myxococcales bacterium]|nr:hypothetical protein [Myxococcales bacterium]
MQNIRRGFAFLVLLLIVSWLACDSGDDDDNDDNSADNATDDDQTTDDDQSTDDDAGDDTGDDDTAATDWVWTPIAGTYCRDGSETGIAIRLAPESENLAVILQGGGACFDPKSCADNPAKFDATDLEIWKKGEGSHGIYNLANPENPVGGWNIAFVPYCTGDLHSGSQPDGTAPGVAGKQQYVGYQNMESIIAHLHEQFGDAKRVLLAGESAGGFGVMLNYAHLARAFENVPVTLLDDSGPLFESNDVLSPCLQLLVGLLWNTDPVVADGCPDCLQLNGDGFSGWHSWLAETFPNGTFGLSSTMEDATIREFFAFGMNHCTGGDIIPAADYRAGLLALRDDLLAPTGRWSTYYVEGASHVALTSDQRFYQTTVGGKFLTEWLAELLMSVPTSVGP